jgi:hypothetical protein
LLRGFGPAAQQPDGVVDQVRQDGRQYIPGHQGGDDEDQRERQRPDQQNLGGDTDIAKQHAGFSPLS